MAAKRAGKKVTPLITKDEKKRKANSKSFMKNIIKNLAEVSEVDRKEHADFLTLLKTER